MSYIPYPPPAELIDILRGHTRFWLATHVNPDADGFGSVLGLGGALSAAGKDVTMIRNEGGPAAFAALPGSDRTTAPDDLGETPEIVILFDCHSLNRIGPAAERLTGNERVVVIDHHVTDNGGGDGEVEWLVTKAAASASLVYSLVAAMDELELTASVATPLYAGLLTDTGGFRFSNTDPTTLRVGAELVEAGADSAELAELFLHRRRPQTIRLLSRVLDTFDYRLAGRVVLARMTLEMCETTGGRMEDTEGFVNFATSAENVSLVALFKEESPTRWRVSLRANDPYDVRLVARKFNGGGHAKAAGCTLDGSLEEVQARILEALAAELERPHVSA